MSLRSPTRNTVLPLRIQERLNDMFARATGFSGPQILDFFSRYDINIEPYPSSGAPPRKQMFEDCLARFDRDAQLHILVDLLNYDGPLKHGTPSIEDIGFVRAWLNGQHVIPSIRGNPTNRFTSDSIAGTYAATARPSTVKEWDAFICHASEDKEHFVRPLVQALKNRGLRVWFDEFTLRVGDRLRRSIDNGLVQSRYGVVIISRAFLEKEWPQNELDGLMTREAVGERIILPVWHNIDAATVRNYSPILADRVATSSSKGIEQVASELLHAMTL